MAAEWAKAASFEQLAKEHQTLVATAMAQRWQAVLEQIGLPAEMLATARQSPEWAGLLGALRDAKDRRLDAHAAISSWQRCRSALTRAPPLFCGRVSGYAQLIVAGIRVPW